MYRSLYTTGRHYFICGEWCRKNLRIRCGETLNPSFDYNDYRIIIGDLFARLVNVVTHCFWIMIIEHYELLSS